MNGPGGAWGPGPRGPPPPGWGYGYGGPSWGGAPHPMYGGGPPGFFPQQWGPYGGPPRPPHPGMQPLMQPNFGGGWGQPQPGVPGEDGPPGEDNSGSNEANSQEGGAEGEDASNNAPGPNAGNNAPNQNQQGYPGMDMTPATCVNGVAFNLAGQRIPGFNPFPSQLMNAGIGGGKKKNKKKNKNNANMTYAMAAAGAGPNSQFQQTQQAMMGTGIGPDGKPVPMTGPPPAIAGAPSTVKTPMPNAAAVSSNPNEWPPALKEYVNRCFSRCTNDVDKDRVEIILKGKITKAVNEQVLWTKNWDAEPLPLEAPSPAKAGPSGRLGRMARGGRLGGGFGARGRDRRGSRSPPRRRRRNSSSSSSSSSDSGARGGGKRRGKSGRDRSPDYGKNPNCIPLGKTGKNSKAGIGKMGLFTKKNKDKNGVPYFFTNTKGGGRMTVDGELGSNAQKQKRAARFAEAGGASKRPRKAPIDLASLNNKLLEGGFEESADGDWEGKHVVGTCQDLEKRYLRLTSAPEAHMVRPVSVLKKSLNMVINHWKNKQDYHYACGQMKSIRQDLTVQGIRDIFTVKVYETHARIALEKGDYTEFNQCQSQLKMLYHDIGGDNRLEFTSYRILYYIYTRETTDITNALNELTDEEKTDECISFVLKLRTAWALQNYYKFFKLYNRAPKMSGFLIDWFVNRERKAALRAIIKAYRVTIPVESVSSQLAFPDSEEWEKFAEPFKLTYKDPEKTILDCKASMSSLPELQ